MIKQYFKQAFAMLRENPLLSLISIVGTALAITMIMVLVIVYVVKSKHPPRHVFSSRQKFPIFVL